MPSASASEALLDEAGFARLFERHRRELHVHCYRMLGSLQDAEDRPGDVPPRVEGALLRSYMDAWDRADVAGLASLLREDARMTMPPTPSWYEGRDAIATFFARHVLVPGRGSYRLLPTRANRQPALAVYRRPPGEATHLPLALKVLRIEGGRVASIDGFVYPDLFPAFGLPTSV